MCSVCKAIKQILIIEMCLCMCCVVKIVLDFHACVSAEKKGQLLSKELHDLQFTNTHTIDTTMICMFTVMEYPTLAL